MTSMHVHYIPEEVVSFVFLMATSLLSERSLSNMTTGAYAFHVDTHGSLDLTLAVRVCACGGGGGGGGGGMST